MGFERRMKISELKANQGKVDLEADVVDVGETRSFIRFGRALRVANATVKDDSGNIKLTLWNDDVDRVKTGDRVKVTNGFVKEFQGELTLTSGREGKLEVVGESESGSEEKAEQTEEPEEKPEGAEEREAEEAEVEKVE